MYIIHMYPHLLWDLVSMIVDAVKSPDPPRYKWRTRKAGGFIQSKSSLGLEFWEQRVLWHETCPSLLSENQESRFLRVEEEGTPVQSGAHSLSPTFLVYPGSQQIGWSSPTLVRTDPLQATDLNMNLFQKCPHGPPGNCGIPAAWTSMSPIWPSQN